MKRPDTGFRRCDETGKIQTSYTLIKCKLEPFAIWRLLFRAYLYRLFHLHAHPEVLAVRQVVPLHLVDAVAAELLDHGRGDLEGHSGLGHHAGRRNGADVGALDARLEGLLAHHVHGAERLLERGDGLHGRAQHDGLAVAHAALDAAGHVRLAEEPCFLVPEDLVVHLGARFVRHAESGTDLDALDRLDAHERCGEPAVELPVPVHVAAEPHGNAGDDQLEHAAQGIARRRAPRRSSSSSVFPLHGRSSAVPRPRPVS